MIKFPISHQGQLHNIIMSDFVVQSYYTLLDFTQINVLYVILYKSMRYVSNLQVNDAGKILYNLMYGKNLLCNWIHYKIWESFGTGSDSEFRIKAI